VRSVVRDSYAALNSSRLARRTGNLLLLDMLGSNVFNDIKF